MDGKTLLYGLRQALNELSDSAFLDDYTSYEYLWEAAITFASRTGALRGSQSITTVANQQGYVLNADYESLYLRNYERDFIVKYNDGSSNSFPTWKDYSEMVYEDDINSIVVPSHFNIIDYATKNTLISSSATSACAVVAGLCTLTDTNADFSDIEAGDRIHNTTRESLGIVTAKISTTVLETALFNGTGSYWHNGDAYTIQPQGRMQLLLIPPPSTVSHTATLYYNQRPDPVFSDYGMYRFPAQYMSIIIRYATWLYKYRDSEPDFGDRLYLYFDRQVKRVNRIYNASSRQDNFHVDLIKRT